MDTEPTVLASQTVAANRPPPLSAYWSKSHTTDSKVGKFNVSIGRGARSNGKAGATASFSPDWVFLTSYSMSGYGRLATSVTDTSSSDVPEKGSSKRVSNVFWYDLDVVFSNPQLWSMTRYWWRSTEQSWCRSRRWNRKKNRPDVDKRAKKRVAHQSGRHRQANRSNAKRNRNQMSSVQKHKKRARLSSLSGRWLASRLLALAIKSSSIKQHTMKNLHGDCGPLFPSTRKCSRVVASSKFYRIFTTILNYN